MKPASTAFAMIGGALFSFAISSESMRITLMLFCLIYSSSLGVSSNSFPSYITIPLGNTSVMYSSRDFSDIQHSMLVLEEELFILLFDISIW